MSIDEAHYYFPQEGAREDFNKEATVINKLTRLGRVRRMGVVFATHSPADLNDLVIQLTKIAMRSEPKVLERMAEYAGAYAQSGAAVAIYRTHAGPSKPCRPRRDTENYSPPPLRLDLSSGGAERRSLCLFCGFRLVDKGGILPERCPYV